MIIPRFVRRWFRAPFDGFRHFAVVDAGVLYRCGQPTPAQLTQLIHEHKLKTVISFRGERDAEDSDAWEADEATVCAEHGAQFVRIPCNHKNPPTIAQRDEFLRIVRDPQSRPVLVHCRLGQQRTMLFVALYWVHVLGWPVDKAEIEMDKAGFNIRHRRHQKLLTAFRELARAEA